MTKSWFYSVIILLVHPSKFSTAQEWSTSFEKAQLALLKTIAFNDSQLAKMKKNMSLP